MPVPKRKRSRARRDSRFANKGMAIKAFTQCRNCENPKRPHQACDNCGFYKGVKALVTKNDRSLKRAEMIKARAGAQAAAEAPSQE
jgi:large subunit ribosomal protein L32